ncbi:MAG: TIGR03084 family metal-binding protein [Jatrophihabitans sp.]
MADVAAVLADLSAEGAELDALVTPLPASDWARETPAEGWTIAHQIGHLAWTDDVSILAATDNAGFAALMADVLTAPTTYVDTAAATRAEQPPAELLQTWRAGRAALADALAAVPADVKLPWFGPSMSAPSMATARLMETWAHGQDVADALSVERPVTDRIRHVAHIGVRTRGFSFLIRERAPSSEPVRVELTAPSGQLWTWGPADATHRVTGPALDFCLLVTQRRHRDDLQLQAIGAEADAWLDVAQAFAGAPGPGRARSLT